MSRATRRSAPYAPGAVGCNAVAHELAAVQPSFGARPGCALRQVCFHPQDATRLFSGSEDGLVQLSSVAGALDEDEGFLVRCQAPETALAVLCLTSSS